MGRKSKSGCLEDEGVCGDESKGQRELSGVMAMFSTFTEFHDCTCLSKPIKLYTLKRVCKLSISKANKQSRMSFLTCQNGKN